MARFRSRGILVNDNKRFPLPGKFIFQAFTKHAKTGTHDVHALHLLRKFYQVRFPYTHSIPGVGYPPAFLVYKVFPLVGYMLLQKAYFLRLFYIGLAEKQLSV